MFARLKKSGKYQYLQIVENRREGKRTVQRVIATLSRMDQIRTKGGVDSLIRSLSRYSEKVLLVLSGKSDVSAQTRKIGPSLIFERLWKELGIPKVIEGLLADRKFGFDVERAIYLTVLHRLFASGSDRYCERWRRDYHIEGTEGLSLHHLYRAMGWVGEAVLDQQDATPFVPRCNKDVGEYHRCEDPASRHRFHVGRFCIVADRGMISKATLQNWKPHGSELDYILGARMRKENEIKDQVLSHPGRYKEVCPEGRTSLAPSPLQVKEVRIGNRRYIVCLNTRQARKDAEDRKAILQALKAQLKKGAKTLIGNKGYRKYLKVEKGTVSIDTKKMEAESRFDGKWVLRTNTDLPPDAVALKYKELWQVEHAFRDMKSILINRPIFHKRDATIKGHVFCSFLALMLGKELNRRLEESGHDFEWAAIKQDLKALQETLINEKGKSLAIRSECQGTCGKVFQAVGVAIPPTIREI